MIASAGFAAPCGRQHRPVDDEEVVDAPDAVVRVDDRVVRREAHARTADEMRVAVDRQRVLRTRPSQISREDVLRERGVSALSFSHWL